MAERKRVVTKKSAKNILTVEDGAVKMNVVPEEVVEVETGDESVNPVISFSTPQGESVYEYIGDCFDCADKRPPVVTPVFNCVSGNVRADEQLGVQLAAFWRGGRQAVKLCQECYRARQGKLPKREIKFSVI